MSYTHQCPSCQKYVNCDEPPEELLFCGWCGASYMTDSQDQLLALRRRMEAHRETVEDEDTQASIGRAIATIHDCFRVVREQAL